MLKMCMQLVNVRTQGKVRGATEMVCKIRVKSYNHDSNARNWVLQKYGEDNWRQVLYNYIPCALNVTKLTECMKYRTLICRCLADNLVKFTSLRARKHHSVISWQSPCPWWRCQSPGHSCGRPQSSGCPLSGRSSDICVYNKHRKGQVLERKRHTHIGIWDFIFFAIREGGSFHLSLK